MDRRIIVAIAVIQMFCWPASAKSDSGNSTSITNLESTKSDQSDSLGQRPVVNPLYAIGAIPLKKYDQSFCGTGPDYKAIYLLASSGQDVVSAMVLLQDGSYVLNPQEGIEYQNIPANEQITEDDAKRLWGEPAKEADYLTYKLHVVKVVDMPGLQQAPVTLDLRFKDKTMKDYRFRSPLIAKSCWYSTTSSKSENAAK